MITLEFNGIVYQKREIMMPFGERTISTVDLNNVLMNSKGSYKSEIACSIDESIFYYVEQEQFNLPDAELAAQIFSEI